MKKPTNDNTETITYEIITMSPAPPLNPCQMIFVPCLFEAPHFYADYVEENRRLKHKQTSPTMMHIKKTIETYFNIHCRKMFQIDKENTIQGNRPSNRINALVVVQLGKFAYLEQKKGPVLIDHILNSGSVVFISRKVAHRFVHKIRGTEGESASLLFACSSYQY